MYICAHIHIPLKQKNILKRISYSDTNVNETQIFLCTDRSCFVMFLEGLAGFDLTGKPRIPLQGLPLSVLCFRIPVHTIFDSCPDGNGIRSIAITRDSKFLATISDTETQVKGPLGRSL